MKNKIISEYMEKLKNLKAVFNRNNLKKGILIGLATASLAGATTGCSNIAGGSDEITPIEQPANNNGTTTNNGGTTNQQENTGNQQGNTGNQQNNNDDQTVIYGHDRTIGNGNYTLHNFKYNETEFYKEPTVTAMNHCLAEAETYVKGLANNLDNSLNGRTAAKDYFKELINDVNADNSFYIKETDPGRDVTFDAGINRIHGAVAPYITKIMTALGATYDTAFSVYYRVLANEAYKEAGLDTADQQNNYDTENTSIKNTTGRDFSYYQNLTNTTTDMDIILGKAASSIGNGVTVSDLRQVINLALTTNSLKGLHDSAAPSLNHEITGYYRDCGLIMNMNTVMDRAISANRG